MGNMSADAVLKNVCPHCKMSVDPEATRCPHCNGKIKQPYKWTTGKKIIVGIFGGLILLGIVSASSSSGNSSSSSSNYPVNGEQGYLRASQNTLPVFTSEDALNQFLQDEDNHDTYGQEQMVDDGEIFFVPNGTQILVIGGGLTTREVRILSGEYTGQSGYVAVEETSAN